MTTGILGKKPTFRNDAIDYSAVFSREPGQENVLFFAVKEPFTAISLAHLGAGNALVLDLVQAEGAVKKVSICGLDQKQIKVIKAGGATLVQVALVDGEVTPVMEAVIATN